MFFQVCDKKNCKNKKYIFIVINITHIHHHSITFHLQHTFAMPFHSIHTFILGEGVPPPAFRLCINNLNQTTKKKQLIKSLGRPLHAVSQISEGHSARKIKIKTPTFFHKIFKNLIIIGIFCEKKMLFD